MKGLSIKCFSHIDACGVRKFYAKKREKFSNRENISLMPYKEIPKRFVR